MFRFVNNYRAKNRNSAIQNSQCLSVQELVEAENYWISISQAGHCQEEIYSLAPNSVLSSKSCLLLLQPFLDSSGILRVGGRQQNSELLYSSLHPVILYGKHPEQSSSYALNIYACYMLDPCTLLASSLCCRFHIIGCCKTVRSITHACTICRRNSAKPRR